MKDKKLTLKTKMSHEECEGENKKKGIYTGNKKWDTSYK